MLIKWCYKYLWMVLVREWNMQAGHFAVPWIEVLYVCVCVCVCVCAIPSNRMVNKSRRQMQTITVKLKEYEHMLVAYCNCLYPLIRILHAVRMWATTISTNASCCCSVYKPNNTQSTFSWRVYIDFSLLLNIHYFFSVRIATSTHSTIESNKKFYYLELCEVNLNQSDKNSF